MRVTLFVPCLVESALPEIGEATARVLARAGVTVEYAEGLTCCGQPLYKTGHFDETRRLARQVVAGLEPATHVVAPSGSCVNMIRHYPELFEAEPAWRDRAQALADRVFELSEFLVRVLGVSDLGAEFSGNAAYHDSCQVGQALGLTEPPRTLLGNVRGLTVHELARPLACCGFGGMFSVQYPEISEAVAEEKIADILATGAEYVVTAEVSCLLHLRRHLEAAGSAVTALHLAEVLARVPGRTSTGGGAS